MEPQFTTNVEDGVFTLIFTAPKRLLLHPDFESMVWDECLRRAHAEGHVPVGPIHIQTDDVANEPQTPLVEGESLTDRMQRWANQHAAEHIQAGLFNLPPPVDVMRVTAEVQIGASIG